MNTYPRLLVCLFTLACFLLPTLIVVPELHAQVGTIKANPNAAKLRRIWMIRGSNYEDYVGEKGGGLGDINGDSLADFVVESIAGQHARTLIYLGDTAAPRLLRRFDTLSLLNQSGATIGDFWGTGHKAVVLYGLRGRVAGAGYIKKLFVFRTESGGLPDTPAAVWTPDRADPPTFSLGVVSALGADLDLDGDDELVIFSSSRAENNKGGNLIAEIWIYDGGPHFQLDSPAVILLDRRKNNSGAFSGKIGDIDGDRYPEILTVGVYSGLGARLNIYWGGPSLPRQGRLPDREVYHSGFEPFLVDCDGDGVMDLLEDGVSLYRSGSGKDARTRSFELDDADLRFIGRGSNAQSVGPLNDKSRRYDMVGVDGVNPKEQTDGMLLVFGGGPNGPDHTYEAWYSLGTDGFAPYGIGILEPLGDVNGDGWSDVLHRNPFYYEPVKMGVAMILAGGPHIPRDSLGATAIRDLPLENKHRALSIWPVPATDVLHIAWRGDLQRMPSRFEVHDMLGRLVARGEVEPWRGEAIWECGEAAAGEYILGIYDSQRVLLTSTKVVKQ